MTSLITIDPTGFTYRWKLYLGKKVVAKGRRHFRRERSEAELRTARLNLASAPLLPDSGVATPAAAMPVNNLIDELLQCASKLKASPLPKGSTYSAELVDIVRRFAGDAVQAAAPRGE